MKPVKLQDIVDELDFQFEDRTSYLNKQTGEIISIAREEMTAAEEEEPLDRFPDWQRENIELAGAILDDEEGNFVPLPDQYDIHEYAIIQDFCYSLGDEEIREALTDAIRGSGAFRRFKDGIQQYGIEEEWYRYKEERLKQIALEWCEQNGVQVQGD